MLQRGWAAYLRSLQKRPLSTKAAAAAFIFFSSDAATQYASHGSAASAPVDPAVHSSASSARTSDTDEAQKLGDSTERPDGDHPGFVDAFQAHRSISAAAFGVFAATWLHYWWNALEVLVAARLPLHAAAASRRSRIANALVKVVIDQSLAAPLYTYAYYVVTNFLGKAYAVSRSEQPASDRPEMKDILVETHEKARSMLWPTMMQHYKLWPAVHFVNFYAVPLQHRVLVQNTVLVFWSAYLSHLNHQHGQGGLHLLTPNEEVAQAQLRRESRHL